MAKVFSIMWRTGHRKVDGMSTTQNNPASELEERLLKIFSSHSSRKKIQRSLSKDIDPMVRQATSPEREQLLSWYPFSPGNTVLEIGDSYGALTGLFARKCKSVNVFEPDKNKALIISRRYKDVENVEHASSLDQISEHSQDYIVIVGKSISEALLADTKRLLSRGGRIILAVDNKMGLKYWNGETDSENRQPFNPIQGFPYGQSNLMGRDGIVEVVRQAGFSRYQFFYPMPGYIFPREIFSDEYLPSRQHPVSAHAASHAFRENQVFSDTLAFLTIVENQKFELFANSFLVIMEAA